MEKMESVPIFEKGDLLHDFQAFMKYVSENDIKLTPRQQMIPRKDIYAINTLFRHPHPMENKVGNVTFKTREEFELIYLHFIDLLSTASGCAKITRTNYLRKGDNFINFANSDSLAKITNLFLSWYFAMSWQNWFMIGGDFAERLQGKAREIAQQLKQVQNKKRIDFKEFANNIIASTCVKWICQAGDRDSSHARFGIEHLLIIPMRYFEIIKTYTQKNEWNMNKLEAFEFNQPLGGYLIDLITARTFDPKVN